MGEAHALPMTDSSKKLMSNRVKANKLSLNAVKTEFMMIGTSHNTLQFGNLLAIQIDDHLI